MSPSVIIAGHSNIRCLMAAEAEAPEPGVEFADLLRLKGAKEAPGARYGEMVRKASATSDPDVICLSIFGNYHNVLGVVEHPQPFSAGGTSGALPPEAGRWFVPSAVIADTFRHQFRRARNITASLYEAFPQARRLFLNPPPPIGDWDHILGNPKLFADKVHLGPAPDALKLRLYELQTEFFAELAADHGARLIETPPEARTATGFLDPDYHGEDPTHGNVAYGRLMLHRILQAAAAEEVA